MEIFIPLLVNSALKVNRPFLPCSIGKDTNRRVRDFPGMISPLMVSLAPAGTRTRTRAFLVSVGCAPCDCGLTVRSQVVAVKPQTAIVRGVRMGFPCGEMECG